MPATLCLLTNDHDIIISTAEAPQIVKYEFDFYFLLASRRINKYHNHHLICQKAAEHNIR